MRRSVIRWLRSMRDGIPFRSRSVFETGELAERSVLDWKCAGVPEVMGHELGRREAPRHWKHDSGAASCVRPSGFMADTVPCLLMGCFRVPGPCSPGQRLPDSVCGQGRLRLQQLRHEEARGLGGPTATTETHGKPVTWLSHQSLGADGRSMHRPETSGGILVEDVLPLTHPRQPRGRCEWAYGIMFPHPRQSVLCSKVELGVCEHQDVLKA
jgi:hypothetical protein